jgi:D-alanyl-D-alanine carboxypeptidase (penicillin-binding protein 5/6)
LKTLALITTLFLHLTGLWQRSPQPIRTDLTSAAVVKAGSSTPTASIALQPLPVRNGSSTLSISATNAYAIDTPTGTVLYAKNPDTPHAIASITKLATAIVILSRHKITETVTIPKLPTYQTADQTMGLVPGESYKLSDLMQALLVYSADDAADAMAIWDAGSTQKFAIEMNAKMSQWGISDAHFSNPSGLIDTGNAVSADAVSKIAGLALTNPFIRTAVNQPTANFASSAGRVFDLPTTDDLLASGQFYGIKTGYTQAAGECFVGLTRIKGHEVITVIIGSGDRFGDTLALTSWIGSNWQWL